MSTDISSTWSGLPVVLIGAAVDVARAPTPVPATLSEPRRSASGGPTSSRSGSGMSSLVLASGAADAVHIICGDGHHHVLGHAEASRLYRALGQVLGLPTDHLAVPEAAQAPGPARP